MINLQIGLLSRFGIGAIFEDFLPLVFYRFVAGEKEP